MAKLRQTIRRFSFFPYGPAIFVACLGIALSIAFYLRVSEQENVLAKAGFQSHAASYEDALRRGIDHSTEAVESVGRFFDASQLVDRREFAKFVGEPLAHHKEIQALGWIPRVADSDRALYEEDASRDWIAGFQFTERQSQGVMVAAAEQAEYFPVYYVEPLVGNESSVGFDLGSNPARRQALEQAMDSASSVATERIVLVQEQAGEYGFLILRPVYEQGIAPATVEERRRNLKGFALGVFRVHDMVEQAMQGLQPLGINVLVSDATAPEEQRFLYLHQEGAQTVSPAAAADTLPQNRSGLQVEATLDVPGRQWSLQLYPAPGLLETGVTPWPWLVLVGGVLSSVGIGAFLFLLGNRMLLARRSAREMATANKALEAEAAERRRRQEENRRLSDRLQLQVNRMPVALIVWDLDFRAQTWNPAAERIFGFEAKEALGQHAYDLIVPKEVQPHVDEVWRRSLAGDMKARSTNQNVTRDGRTITCEWTNTPLTGADGKVTGVLSMVEDISERVHAEEALRDSEKHYRSLFENMLNGFAYCRMIFEGDQAQDFVYVNVNDSFERLTGLKDVVGKRVSEVLPGLSQSSPELFEACARAARGGPPERFEFHMPQLDTWLDISVYSTKRGYFIAVFDNITGRKSAEKALMASEQKYRTIIETSNEGVMIISPEDNLDFVNDKMAAMLGFTRAELEGTLGLKLFEEDQREAVLRRREKVRQYGRTQDEYKFRRKDGSILWTIANVSTLNDEAGRRIGNLAMHTDITERKRIEEALRASEQKYRTFIETANEGIIVIDPEGKVSFVNDKMAEMFGYSAQELKGKPGLDLVSEDQREIVMRARQGARQHGRLQVEYQMLRKDGSPLWTIVNISPIYDEAGRYAGNLGMHTDISERKRAEEELKQAMAELERFTYTVSHDLKSPVVTIKTFLGYLKADISTSNVGRIEKDIMYMSGAADKIDSLVETPFSRRPDC